MAGTPAATSGLQAGDKILAIDGTPVRPADIPRIISSSKGHALVVRVERDHHVRDDRAGAPEEDLRRLPPRFRPEGAGLVSAGRRSRSPCA